MLRLNKWLLFLFVLFLPLANHDRYFLFLPKLYPSRLILVLLIIFSFPILAEALRKSDVKNKLLSDKLFLVLLGLFAVRAVSLVNSLNLQNSLFLLAFFGSVIALYLILKNLAKTDKEFFAFLFQLYLVVIVVISAFGLLQYLLALAGVILPGVLRGGNYFRIPATFYDANHLPPFISTGIFFFLGLSFLKKEPKRRWGFLLLTLVLVMVSLLTFSRSGFLGLVVGALAFGGLAFKEGFKRELIPLIGVFALFVVGVLYFSHRTHYSLVDRMFKSLVDPAEKSTVAHYQLLLGEWRLFLDNPVLGVGYGGFSEAFRASPHSKAHTWVDPVKDIRLPAHSIWLETLTETGLIGFAFYFAFMFLAALSMLRALFKVSVVRDKVYLIAFISGFFALLSGGIFYSYNLLFFWYFIFVAVIFSRQVILSNHAQE